MWGHSWLLHQHQQRAQHGRPPTARLASCCPRQPQTHVTVASRYVARVCPSTLPLQQAMHTQHTTLLQRVHLTPQEGVIDRVPFTPREAVSVLLDQMLARLRGHEALHSMLIDHQYRLAWMPAVVQSFWYRASECSCCAERGVHWRASTQQQAGHRHHVCGRWRGAQRMHAL
jgi:hypothetical protein